MVLVLAAFVAIVGRVWRRRRRGRRRGPVRFLVFGEPEELKAYRDVVAAYREERARRRTSSSIEASDRTDLITRLSTSLAGGSPPDVFLMNYRFYGQFAAKDAIEPIDGAPGGLRRLRAGGLLPPGDGGLPVAAASSSACRRTSPASSSTTTATSSGAATSRSREAGWTWAELVAIATRLTPDENGIPVASCDPDQRGASQAVAVYGLGVEPTLIRIAPFVWSNGGELVDDERQPTRFTLDTPEALKALEHFLALRSARVDPTDVEVEAEDDEARFANGRLGDAPLVAALDADLPHDRRLRLGRGAAAGHARAGRDPALGRLLHDRRLGPQGRGLALRRVRPRPEGQRDHRPDRPHGAVADRGLALARVPRPVAARRATPQVFLDGIPTIRRVPTISTWPEIEDASEPILENGLYLGRRAARSRSSSTRRRGRSSRAAKALERPAARGARQALRRRSRRFDGLDLEVADGELLVVLGPSGCGQVDAAAPRRRARGRPTAGRILIGGRDVTRPRRRGGATWRWSSRATRSSRT